MRRILPVLIALLATPAPAQNSLQFQTLDQSGSWAAEMMFNRVSKNLMCTALTSNDAGQSFWLFSDVNQDFVLRLADDAWDLDDRTVTFGVRVGSFSQQFEGSTSQTAVFASLDSFAARQALLDAIAAGNTLTIVTDAGETIATHSLRGSGVVIATFVDCVTTITAPDFTVDPSDPFRIPVDPF